MELKEFRYPDNDPDGPWPDIVYAVLRKVREPLFGPDDVESRTDYIINPDDTRNSLTVSAVEIDYYIEIFNWIKQRETVNND